MQVVLSDGKQRDQVTDVRMRRGDVHGHLPELVVQGLIVGRNRPGTLFGYDRDRQRGPWMIQRILRFVHRHTGYVAWSDVASVDWERRVVTRRTAQLEPIEQEWQT